MCFYSKIKKVILPTLYFRVWLCSCTGQFLLQHMNGIFSINSISLLFFCLPSSVRQRCLGPMAGSSVGDTDSSLREASASDSS